MTMDETSSPDSIHLPTALNTMSAAASRATATAAAAGAAAGAPSAGGEGSTLAGAAVAAAGGGAGSGTAVSLAPHALPLLSSPPFRQPLQSEPMASPPPSDARDEFLPLAGEQDEEGQLGMEDEGSSLLLAEEDEEEEETDDEEEVKGERGEAEATEDDKAEGEVEDEDLNSEELQPGVQMVQPWKPDPAARKERSGSTLPSPKDSPPIVFNDPATSDLVVRVVLAACEPHGSGAAADAWALHAASQPWEPSLSPHAAAACFAPPASCCCSCRRMGRCGCGALACARGLCRDDLQRHLHLHEHDQRHHSHQNQGHVCSCCCSRYRLCGSEEDPCAAQGSTAGGGFGLPPLGGAAAAAGLGTARDTWSRGVNPGGCDETAQWAAGESRICSGLQGRLAAAAPFLQAYVHRHVLRRESEYFEATLSDRWTAADSGTAEQHSCAAEALSMSKSAMMRHSPEFHGLCEQERQQQHQQQQQQQEQQQQQQQQEQGRQGHLQPDCCDVVSAAAVAGQQQQQQQQQCSKSCTLGSGSSSNSATGTRAVVVVHASEFVSDPAAYLTALRFLYMTDSPDAIRRELMLLMLSPSPPSASSPPTHRHAHAHAHAHGSDAQVCMGGGNGAGPRGGGGGRGGVLAVLDVLAVASEFIAPRVVEQCVACLEAAPWDEDEEELVALTLADLQLSGVTDSSGHPVLGRLPLPCSDAAAMQRRLKVLLERCIKPQPQQQQNQQQRGINGSSSSSSSTAALGLTSGVPGAHGYGYGYGHGCGYYGGLQSPGSYSGGSAWGGGMVGTAGLASGPGRSLSSAAAAEAAAAAAVAPASAVAAAGEASEVRTAAYWILKRPSDVLTWDGKREVVMEVFVGLRKQLEAEYDRFSKRSNSSGVFQSRRDTRKLAKESAMAWLVALMLELLLMADVVFQWLATSAQQLAREVKYCCLNAEEPHKLAKVAVHGALRAFTAGQVIVPADVRCAFVKQWYPILSDDSAFVETRLFFNVKCRAVEVEDVVRGFNALVATLPASEQEALFRVWKRQQGRRGNGTSSSSSASSSTGGSASAGGGLFPASSLPSSFASTPAGAAAGSSLASGIGFSSGHSAAGRGGNSSAGGSSGGGGKNGSNRGAAAGGGRGASASASPFTLREAYVRWLKRLGEPCSLEQGSSRLV